MFDAHVHIQDPRYSGILDGVIERAKEAQITGLCCCGTAPADWQRVGDVAQRYTCGAMIIVPAYGVHPWYVEELDDTWRERLDAFLDADPVAAAGEIGLDGLRREISRELQKKIFVCQMELAAVHHRPVVLHGARAWGELTAALAPYAGRVPAIVAHGFSGSAEIMRTLLDMGAYLSFAGSVCNPQASSVREAAAQVPLGQLLIETDSPDIFPTGGAPAATDTRNRPLNQPSNLQYICSTVASLRRVPSEIIADITASNARTAFLSG